MVNAPKSGEQKPSDPELSSEPDPVVQQILHRREEIRVHQQVLKELESGLTEAQKAELSKASAK